METEEQGEEGDATEKVQGQQNDPRKSKISRLLQRDCCILGQRRRERGGGEPAVGLGDAGTGQSHLQKVSTTRLHVSLHYFSTFYLSVYLFLRKDTKEEQLMAAQAHLKLGEVSAESGM